MDTFTCSSWYYLRYTDPHNTELPFDSAKTTVGCRSINTSAASSTHPAPAVQPLLHEVLRDLGMLDFDEPFKNLLCQGMVLDEHGDV